jgi:hypothetical protein
MEDRRVADPGELGELLDPLLANDRDRTDPRLPRPLVEQRLVRVHAGDRVIAEQDRLPIPGLERPKGGGRLGRERAGRLAAAPRLAFHQVPLSDPAVHPAPIDLADALAVRGPAPLPAHPLPPGVANPRPRAGSSISRSRRGRKGLGVVRGEAQPAALVGGRDLGQCR